MHLRLQAGVNDMLDNLSVPGCDSNDIGFYLPDCSFSLQNALSSNYAKPHVALDF